MPTNLDPLLEAIRPGVFVVFSCAIAATFGTLLADGLIRAGSWIAGIPERRRQARLDLLRAVIRDWNQPD